MYITKDTYLTQAMATQSILICEISKWKNFILISTLICKDFVWYMSEFDAWTLTKKD